VSNLLAAIAVGIEFDVELDAMPGCLSALGPTHRRGEVLRLSGDVVVVDDTYNASPSAVERMLEACGRDGRRRFVACLGEMLELGDQTATLHARVGRAAHRAGVSQLITVGGDAARAMADEAVRAGLAPDAVHCVADSALAATLAQQVVRDGDLVLVKGSNGIQMERVVERLQRERG
jgi:UDP-N-acetylmuramoyl-tripeptide--D-alanyl-D-alanine ligase